MMKLPPTKHLLITLVCALGVAGMTLRWLDFRPPTKAGSDAQLAMERAVTELQAARLDLAEAAMHGADPRLLVKAPPTVQMAEPTTPNPAEPEPAERETKKPAPPPDLTEEQRNERAEEVFQAQPVDTAWATETRSALLASIAAFPDSPVTTHDIECRSTLCRMELNPANDSEARDYVGDFLRSDAWQGAASVMREVHEDGTTVARLYLAVDGEELPDNYDPLETGL